MAALIDNNRLTIGLALGSMKMYNHSLCKAMIDVFKERDLNLVIFPNNFREIVLPHYYTSTIFDHGYKYTDDYINPHNIDGLILTQLTPPELTTHRSYSDYYSEIFNVPIVSINSNYEDIPSISPDNQSGIKEALEHLIKEHGYRKIAFIKGIGITPHSVERYQAYLDVLNNYHIPFNPEIVMQGDFSFVSGRVAAQKLLELPRDAFEAIVSSNDEMAIGAVQVFYENGMEIPKDIKIVGYDYAIPLQYELCPLATVKQPFREMAIAAVDSIIKQLKHEDVPLLTKLPSKFIKRPSCGCHYPPIDENYSVKNEFKKIFTNTYVDVTAADRVHKFISTRLEGLKSAIVEELPYLKIKKFFIIQNHSENDYIDKSNAGEHLLSKLAMCYQNGRLNKDAEDVVFDRKKILPEGLFEETRQVTMILGPLSFEDKDYGILFYEMGDTSNFADYEYIRRQLCSSLNNIFLIEELKKAQERMIHAEKMASLGTLVAGIAHEINTPIGVTVSAASYSENNASAILEKFKKGTLKKADFQSYLEASIETEKIILENLKKASNLITSFKNISADRSNEVKRNFFVRDYLDQIVLSLKPQIKKTNHLFEIICDPVIEIESYPGIFSLIVTNFIQNSLIHAYKPEDKGKIIIKFSVAFSKAKLLYSDDGAGIKAENLKYIFDPFFTTKRGSGGTGLGLSLVYNLVKENLKGDITCQSREGQGTTFNVEWDL